MNDTPFSVRIAVRTYELDSLGHVNQAVYHSYAEVARTELFRAAGCRMDWLAERKIGPVLLESTITFRRELRADDEVDVSADVKFGAGKTFRMDSTITKVDGSTSAEITCTIGLMDLRERKLVTDPREAFVSAGTDLSVLSGSG
ncbi:MAG: thioesterase [Pseudonocardiaceae bacterium]|nr:thioesterase [Pseudonocardiaceae bacterium]